MFFLDFFTQNQTIGVGSFSMEEFRRVAEKLELDWIDIVRYLRDLQDGEEPEENI